MRAPFAEVLFADGGKLRAMADIDEECSELDDISQRTPFGLNLGLQGVVGGAGLGRKVARMPG